MVYITTNRAPAYKQMTLDDLLNDAVSADDFGSSRNTGSTYTYTVDRPNKGLIGNDQMVKLFRALQRHNEIAKPVLEVEDSHTLFETFYRLKSNKGMPHFVRSLFDAQGRYVPCDYKQVFRQLAEAVHPLLEQHETADHKRLFDESEQRVFEILGNAGFNLDKVDFGAALKGAFRRIDAPKPALCTVIDDLKRVFETDFHAKYHTSAYAYVCGRCNVDAVRRHQSNGSNWFGHLDLSNFFNSTTPEFVMKMLSLVFPFSELCINPTCRAELEKAIAPVFLDGGLPQGTTISPLLTNIIMIPIDHALANNLHHYQNQRYIYTRYADDFIISSEYTFDIRKIERLVKATLEEFGAPFTVNESKTHYGSRAGSNWLLGVMLNKDNNITVGHKNIRAFKTKLFQYVMDAQSGNPWSKSEVRKLDGLRSYYSMVEEETISKIIDHMSKTTGVDIRAMIRRDMRA